MRNEARFLAELGAEIWEVQEQGGKWEASGSKVNGRVGSPAETGHHNLAGSPSGQLCVFLLLANGVERWWVDPGLKFHQLCYIKREGSAGHGGPYL